LQYFWAAEARAEAEQQKQYYTNIDCGKLSSEREKRSRCFYLKAYWTRNLSYCEQMTTEISIIEGDAIFIIGNSTQCKAKVQATSLPYGIE
jgi:hypothetical protein